MFTILIKMAKIRQFNERFQDEVDILQIHKESINV